MAGPGDPCPSARLRQLRLPSGRRPAGRHHLPLQIQGCSHVIFGILGNKCDDLSTPYSATTLQFANASNRPTPLVVAGDGISSTAIAISWSVTPNIATTTTSSSTRPSPRPAVPQVHR